METNINSSIIKEILSLRYCPSIKSSKNKILVDDFLPEEKLDYLKYIENSISSEIKKKLQIIIFQLLLVEELIQVL